MTVAAWSGPAGAAAPKRRRRIAMSWFVPTRSWRAIVGWSAVLIPLGILLAPQESAWVPVGVVISVMLFWHTLRASRTVPWLPGLIAGIAGVQWVLAALAVYHSAYTIDPEQIMALPADEYFAFAVPSLLALIVGLWWPLRREAHDPPIPAPAAFRVPRDLRRTCELMVWGGLIARLGIGFAPGTLRFAVLLVGQLPFVGAFALMIGRVPGWWIRLAAVLAVEFVFSSRDGMFILLVLWSVCGAALLIYRYRVRAAWIVLALLFGGVVINAMNAYKRLYRNQVNSEETAGMERTRQASQRISDILSKPGELFSAENLAYSIGRVNQGTITSRVLVWVPNAEPYAGGETVVNAVKAAIVPRIVSENKYVAGGTENLERFTGIQLINGTSMNLSIPGEMYANFGRTGGVIAVFVYGVCVGMIFRMFLRWSRRSPLWWAWAPYVLLATLSAEDGLGETLNRLTKTMLVMFAVIYFAPGWEGLRRRKPIRAVTRPLPTPPAPTAEVA